jgi:hypothetical protein
MLKMLETAASTMDVLIQHQIKAIVIDARHQSNVPRLSGFLPFSLKLEDAGTIERSEKNTSERN